MLNQTIREALFRASSFLEQEKLNPMIAEWLLLHLLQVRKKDLLLKLEEPLSHEELIIFQSWLERVRNGEPYQYIVGIQEFYGREFEVSPAVLIPRPETELLIEHSLQHIDWLKAHPCKQAAPGRGKLIGIDVGTGSGVIGITLALEAANVEMLAVDISLEALEVAKRNAIRHHASVQFEQSDLLSACIDTKQKLDFIISNPPYIPYSEKDKLDRNVVDFEPHLALFAEDLGLRFYQQIIQQSINLLNRPGFIAFEIGIGQANEIITMMKLAYPHAECTVQQDYQGIERMVFAKIT